MDIGLAIKKVRKNKGLTQNQLCDKINMTQTYLSLMEGGHKTPSIGTLKKISKAVDIPLALLFWFTISEEDVKKDKVDIYKKLKPSIDNLLKDIFY